MPDDYDQDTSFGIFDFIDRTVVADADAVAIVTAGELLAPERARLVPQAIDAISEPPSF
jgi:hypothetical protein